MSLCPLRVAGIWPVTAVRACGHFTRHSGILLVILAQAGIWRSGAGRNLALSLPFSFLAAAD